ncbi:hypothetical protein JTB14_030829 [Gonioctena quinquepunctata]|nr:hypothetical protein JTB14_030829 [Gonioctena quinquepunctata]
MSKYKASLKSQCRACMENVPFLYSLEGLLANCDVNILTMITYCTQTELELCDDLPSGVCIPCFRTIRIAYNFIRQFNESQEKFIEKINQSQSEGEAEIENDENDSIENELANGTEMENNRVFQNAESEPQLKTEIATEEDATERTAEDTDEGVNKEEDENELGSQSETEHGPATEAQETELGEEEYMEFLESEDIDMKQEEFLIMGNEKTEIQYDVGDVEYDTNDSDLLVEHLESGLYELEDSGRQNNYKVRIIRQEAPPNSLENTVFRMKLNTRYSCPVCPNVFFRYFERGLLLHMAEHADEAIKCNVCSESEDTYDVDLFLKHYVDIHLHQCHFCQKSFQKRSSLMYHLKTHTNILYSCKYEGCGKVYPSRTALNKHETTHTDSVKHICSECGLNFKTYDTYRYHMNKHKGKKFLCSICGRTFILSVNLKNHMLAHRGGRPFRCSFCDKTYTTYTPLNKHMRKYHADRKIANSRYYQYDTDV